MAFQSKSGKKFGNIFQQRKHDEMHPEQPSEDKKPMDRSTGLSKPATASEPKAPSKMNAQGMAKESPEHEAKESPEFEAGENEGAEESQEPGQVVAQHGKATSVHVHSDHKRGKHHVVSHHPDGHMHQSEHSTPQEAHDTAKQLGGGDQGAEQEQGAGMGMGQESNDGFQMPAL